MQLTLCTWANAMASSTWRSVTEQVEERSRGGNTAIKAMTARESMNGKTFEDQRRGVDLDLSDSCSKESVRRIRFR